MKYSAGMSIVYTMKKLIRLAMLFAVVVSAQAVVPGSITKFKPNIRKKEYTLITDQNIHYKVVFCRDDVVRILAAPDGKFADPRNDPEKAQIVIDTISRAARVDVTNSADQVKFSTDKLILKVDKKSCRFELDDAGGKLIWKEVKPLDFGKNKTVQTLSSHVDEYYYGGGQQNGYFSQKGRKIEIRADGNWGDGGHPNPAPFYMSNRGYGVLRNTFAVGAYDFRNNQSIGLEHNENRFDAYYFVGKSLHRTLDLYTQFTGRPNFIPIWGLEMGDADAC